MTPELPKSESDRVEILFTGVLDGAEPKTAEIAKIGLLEMTVNRKLHLGLRRNLHQLMQILITKVPEDRYRSNPNSFGRFRNSNRCRKSRIRHYLTPEGHRSPGSNRQNSLATSQLANTND